jgi:hypothetical protein
MLVRHHHEHVGVIQESPQEGVVLVRGGGIPGFRAVADAPISRPKN